MAPSLQRVATWATLGQLPTVRVPGCGAELVKGAVGGRMEGALP